MNGRGYPGFPQYAMHAHNGHGLLWLFFLVLFVAALAVIAALVFRSLAGRRSGWLRPAVVTGMAAGDALSVVRLRYARGEIDRDQFLQATADLTAQPESPAAAGPPPDAPTVS